MFQICTIILGIYNEFFLDVEKTVVHSVFKQSMIFTDIILIDLLLVRILILKY